MAPLPRPHIRYVRVTWYVARGWRPMTFVLQVGRSRAATITKATSPRWFSCTSAGTRESLRRPTTPTPTPQLLMPLRSLTVVVRTLIPRMTPRAVAWYLAGYSEGHDDVSCCGPRMAGDDDSAYEHEAQGRRTLRASTAGRWGDAERKIGATGGFPVRLPNGAGLVCLAGWVPAWLARAEAVCTRL